MRETKTCTLCGTEKPVTAFRVVGDRSRLRLRGRCRACEDGLVRIRETDDPVLRLDKEIELVRSETLHFLRLGKNVSTQLLHEAERALDALVTHQPPDWWRHRVKSWSLSQWIAEILPEHGPRRISLNEKKT